MKPNIISAGLLFITIWFCFSKQAQGQDKVYPSDGTLITGKVKEIGPREVRIGVPNNRDTIDYVYYKNQLDSIVFASGRVEIMDGAKGKKNRLENIPQLNTWSFDLLGFTFLSVSQSYERRLKNGLVGFRVPLYIAFIGGGIAGAGTFLPGQGVYYPQTNGGYYSYTTNGVGYGQNFGGAAIATGLNPRFYLFKRRVVRAFAGPETTIGVSVVHYYTEESYSGYQYETGTVSRAYGTFALLGKVGLSFNPTDKFNLAVDGGAGAGDIFGGSGAIGWTGLWHIGFSMGVNF